MPLTPRPSNTPARQTEQNERQESSEGLLESLNLEELIENFKNSIQEFFDTLSQTFPSLSFLAAGEALNEDNAEETEQTVQAEFNALSAEELNRLDAAPTIPGPMANLQHRLNVNGRDIFSMNLPGVDLNNDRISRSYEDPSQLAKIEEDLSFLRDDMGVSHMIGFQDARQLSPIANEIEGLSYWAFVLHSSSYPDDIHPNNLEAYAALDAASQRAEGNVCTHCRNGLHRARTSVVISYICNHPPSDELNLDGLNPTDNSPDQERIDEYLQECMLACGIPSGEFNYLSGDAVQYLQIHMRMFATDPILRANLLERSSQINPSTYQPDPSFAS